MKAVAAMSAALLAASVFAGVLATDKIKVQVAPKQGATYRQKLSLTTVMNGADLNLKASYEVTVKSVENDVATLTAKWSDHSVDVGGSPVEIPFEDGTAQVRRNGEVLKVTGGIEQSDPVRMFLLTHFVPPPGEIEEGGKYAVDFPELDKGQVPAHKYEGVYVGKAEFKRKSALKFTGHYSEPGKESLVADVTFLVTDEGTVLDADCAFKNLPVPGIGSSFDGKLKLTSAE